jgi:hypothetical protein
VFPLDGSAVRATTVPPFVDVSPPRAGARWTAPPDFCPPPEEPPDEVPPPEEPPEDVLPPPEPPPEDVLPPPPEPPPDECPPDDDPPLEPPRGTARCAERFAVRAHAHSRAAATLVMLLVLMVGLWVLYRLKEQPACQPSPSRGGQNAKDFTALAALSSPANSAGTSSVSFS